MGESVKFLLRQWALIGTRLLAALALLASANASAVGSWTEEVLLHDGHKLMAERYVLRGGRSEIGQAGSYTQQSLQFAHPKTGQTIVWTDNRSEDIGASSFLPMLLDIADGTPYLVAYPMGCLSYNKWGRPNPPYVVFKHQANAWQRIALEELPSEIQTPNLIQSSPDLFAQKLGNRVSAEVIQKNTKSLTQAEYRTIVREPIISAGRSCGEMVSNGKGKWIGVGWFRDQPSLAACTNYCLGENFDEKSCPCNQFFQSK